MPTVILFMEKIVLKRGEYFPIQIPKNKTIAEMIISLEVINIGEIENITPTNICGIFLITSS